MAAIESPTTPQSTRLKRFADAFYAFDADDTSKMEALLAEDIVLETPERVVHGRTAAMAFFRANTGAFKNIVHEVDHERGVIDAGDAQAVEFWVSGEFVQPLDATSGIAPTAAAASIVNTGRPFRFRCTDHIWWKDAYIVRFHIYYDRADFFNQLGIDVTEAESKR